MYKVQQEAYIAENFGWKLLKADRNLQPNVDLLENVLCSYVLKSHILGNSWNIEQSNL
jgi:hypothetical protein